jgi:hypothetical protein
MEGKGHLDVGSQLRSALKKDASYDRLVFIEMNIADSMTGDGADALISNIVQVLNSRERLTVDGGPTPPAYVIVTNNPYSYYPDSAIDRWAGAHGYKIPDLKIRTQFQNLREMINARDKHREIFDLMESVRNHAAIPSTFDGQIPEFAFGNASSRLIIGNEYPFSDENGAEVLGVLHHANVIEEKKSAYCIFELANGRNTLVSVNLTDAELAAYQSHRDTFFGTYDTRAKGPMKDPLELYDWFHKSYAQASTEQLLANMKVIVSHSLVRYHCCGSFAEGGLLGGILPSHQDEVSGREKKRGCRVSAQEFSSRWI